MALKLPRLQSIEPVVRGDGKPTVPMQQKWQKLAETVEGNFDAVEVVLDALTGVEGSVTGLQARSTILDNLSAVTGMGLIEKTGTSALAVRGIGAAAPANVLTMLDSDNRYLKSTGTVVASAASITHKLPVVIGGVTYHILLSNV